MKRIQFTRHELDLINGMAAIASAAVWGEGDYMDWGDRDMKAYNSLREKVHALLERKEKGKPDAGTEEQEHREG